MKENQEALAVYLKCCNQVIISGEGNIIDMNLIALDKAMELSGVEDRLACYQKVMAVFHHYLEDYRLQRKATLHQQPHVEKSSFK